MSDPKCAGRPAAKRGDRYEELCAVAECLRMLRGETEAIRIEDPRFEKVDFVVALPSRREFHQVKRHHPSGRWSLAELDRVGLLAAMGKRLESGDHLFVLRSGSDAPELRSVCEAAGDAESLEEFERHFPESAQRANTFAMLQRVWGCDSSTTMGRLRRIEVRNMGEHELEQMVLWGCSRSFSPTRMWWNRNCGRLSEARCTPPSIEAASSGGWRSAVTAFESCGTPRMQLRLQRRPQTAIWRTCKAD